MNRQTRGIQESGRSNHRLMLKRDCVVLAGWGSLKFRGKLGYVTGLSTNQQAGDTDSLEAGSEFVRKDKTSHGFQKRSRVAVKTVIRKYREN